MRRVFVAYVNKIALKIFSSHGTMEIEGCRASNVCVKVNTPTIFFRHDMIAAAGSSD